MLENRFPDVIDPPYDINSDAPQSYKSEARATSSSGSGSKIEDLVDVEGVSIDSTPSNSMPTQATATPVPVQVKVPLVIARLQYTSIIQSIRMHLATLTRVQVSMTSPFLLPIPLPLPPIPPLLHLPNPLPIPTRLPLPLNRLIPSNQDFELPSTLKVLINLQLPVVKDINVQTIL